jgi:hypothetical protein
MLYGFDHGGSIYLCQEDDPIDSQSLTRYMRDRGGYIMK